MLKRHAWAYDPVLNTHRCTSRLIFNVPEAEQPCNGCGAVVTDPEVYPYRELGGLLAVDYAEALKR